MNKSFITGITTGVLVSTLLFGGFASDAADDVASPQVPQDQIENAETAGLPDEISKEEYQNVKSIENIEKDVDEDLNDDSVRVVYRTPDSCKEFTLYLDNLASTLQKREKALLAEKTMITEMKKEFEQLTQNYETTEARIKKIVQYDPSNLKDNPQLAKMVKLYETFTPEEAAARLKNLDLDLTLAILKGMRPKTLSKVLSAMEPKLSAALSSRIVRGF